MCSHENPSEEMSRKRVKRRHDPIKCEIELENGLICRQVLGQLVCEICKYLLYDRQQIPFPLSNSKSLVQLNDKSLASKLTPKEELILSMVKDLNKLFDELICIMKLNDITIESVCLSFGQTLQIPKELYCIEMPSKDIYNTKHSKFCKTISLRSAVTRFFKTILNDGNILFQSRKDIALTKMFFLVKVRRSQVSLLLQHSIVFHLITDECQQYFTPHIDYELPKIGNRFQFTIKQKQCDCLLSSNDNDFDIYDENKSETIDENLDQDLSKTMNESLTISNTSIEASDDCQDFVWVQIRSSVKGVQYNNSKKDDLIFN